MKKQMKNVALAALLTTVSFGSTAFAGDDNTPNIDDNRLKNRVEYKDMQVALDAIDESQARIEFYKQEKKANRKADKTIALHMSKKELRKARVDLAKEKAYLRIDKRDLKKDQKVAMKEERKEVRAAKKDLRQAKRKKRKSDRQDDYSTFIQSSNKVDDLESKVEMEKQQSEALEEDVDEFFDYLDDEIDETLKK